MYVITHKVKIYAYVSLCTVSKRIELLTHLNTISLCMLNENFSVYLFLSLKPLRVVLLVLRNVEYVNNTY